MQGTNNRQSWVYFIRVGRNGPIKIGRSNRLDVRLNDLQVANHADLEPLLVILDQGKSELALHRRFANLSIRGEWFHPGEPLLNLIADLRGLSLRRKRVGAFLVPAYRGDFDAWLSPSVNATHADVEVHESVSSPELTRAERRALFYSGIVVGTKEESRKYGRMREKGLIRFV